MHKLLLPFFLISFTVTSQESISRELDSILNIDQAERYLANNPSKGSKLISFNEEKHKTKLAKELFERGRSTVESDFKITHYKVVESTEIPHYRVSYIYLDGKKLSAAEIRTLRSQIMTKYGKGVPFDKLAKAYSMDGNANRGGDLGWFTKGEMHPEFENAIVKGAYNVGDVFTVDINEKQWYYVVLKTFEPKNIKEVKALKIVEYKK